MTEEVRCKREFKIRNSSVGPKVQNLPCEAGEVGLTPGWEIKIPPALEQLSLCAATPEPI